RDARFAICWSTPASLSRVTGIWGIVETAAEIRYSIVVPLYNEQNNVRPLYSRIVEAMMGESGTYEIVFVDDGSRDHTFKILSEICTGDSRVTVVRLRKNFGQTA